MKTEDALISVFRVLFVILLGADIILSIFAAYGVISWWIPFADFGLMLIVIFYWMIFDIYCDLSLTLKEINQKLKP